jgi:glucokinase
MLLADLGGNALTQWSHVMREKQKTPAGVCTLIQEGLREMCQASGVPLARVMHLTAGAPGITDVTAGIVLSAPNLLDWNEVPLRSLLHRKLDISISVENDTNLAAVGEHLSGAARGSSNFVFLAIGTGVGAGIFLNDQLLHGTHWSAGEIGYFGVAGKPRDPMRLREAGQLESVIGGGGIELRWQKLIARSRPKPAPELMRLHATQIFDRAAEGDRCAREIAARTADLLADAIADISLLLNPQMVILGGGVGSHPELCRLTRAAIERHELASRLILRSSALGTQAQLRGAINTSLEALQTTLLPG